MGSNIRVTKVCEYCSQEFIAKTIQTRYCSRSCNNKAYKEAKSKEKVELAVSKPNPANPPKFNCSIINYACLHGKEFLSLT